MVGPSNFQRTKEELRAVDMAEQLASVEQLSGVFSALARGHVLEADRMLLDMRALKVGAALYIPPLPPL